jgi:hypothetical protein
MDCFKKLRIFLSVRVHTEITNKQHVMSILTPRYNQQWVLICPDNIINNMTQFESWLKQYLHWPQTLCWWGDNWYQEIPRIEERDHRCCQIYLSCSVGEPRGLCQLHHLLPCYDGHPCLLLPEKYIINKIKNYNSFFVCSLKKQVQLHKQEENNEFHKLTSLITNFLPLVSNRCILLTAFLTKSGDWNSTMADPRGFPVSSFRIST